MPEGPPINPEEYAHEKGDFTDVHNPEFQDELREAGLEPAEEKEFELTPEVQEIMDLVQDIDMPGIGYTGVTFVNRETLIAVLQNGLFQVTWPRGIRKNSKLLSQESPRKQRKFYLESVKREQKGNIGPWNSAHIFFNITGRSKHKKDSREIDQASYAHWYKGNKNSQRFVILFNLKAFREIPLGENSQDNDDLYSKRFQYKVNQTPLTEGKVSTTDLGFHLHGRVAPRFLTGIIAPNYYYDEESGHVDSIDDSCPLEDYILSMDRTGKRLPIYDLKGNLLWPILMSYEEVKQFVSNRNKKEEPKEQAPEDQEL